MSIPEGKSIREKIEKLLRELDPKAKVVRYLKNQGKFYGDQNIFGVFRNYEGGPIRKDMTWEIIIFGYRTVIKISGQYDVKKIRANLPGSESCLYIRCGPDPCKDWLPLALSIGQSKILGSDISKKFKFKPFPKTPKIKCYPVAEGDE